MSEVSRYSVRNILHRVAAFALATFLIQTSANAQSTTSADFNNAGSSGSTFSNIWVGARASAMGGGYSALADDISALYWNPAGIARLNGINVGATYTKWFAGITHNFIGATMAITDRYRLGLGVTVMDYGAIEHTTLDKNSNGGTYNANDMSLGLTLAGALTDRFSFGITAKYLRNAILDLNADGFAFDAGSLYQTDFYHLKISLALTNLGPDRNFSGNSLSILVANPDINITQRPLDTRLVTNDFPIPLSFRIGAATDVFQGNMEDQKLNVAVDFSAHSDGPEVFNLGGEYLWNDMFAIRAGYAFNQDQLGLGAGLGYRYKSEDFNGNIDFALNTTKSLGMLYRASISAMFP